MGVATNTKVPCFNCSNRSTTCHSTCEQYLLYKKEHDSQQQNIKKQKALESIITGMTIDGMRRNTRSKCGVVGQL